jgi:hypothetical protein
MTDERDETKSIKERVGEFVQGVLDALESIVAPAPALVPVPVRPARRPVRTRR